MGQSGTQQGVFLIGWFGLGKKVMKPPPPLGNPMKMKTFKAKTMQLRNAIIVLIQGLIVITYEGVKGGKL